MGENVREMVGGYGKDMEECVSECVSSQEARGYEDMGERLGGATIQVRPFHRPPCTYSLWGNYLYIYYTVYVLSLGKPGRIILKYITEQVDAWV